jgi:hypothetical protein
MVNKTTSFKKAKGAKGSFKKGNGKCVAPTEKKLKSRPKPNTECFYCKDKVIDVYLTSARCSA